MISEKDILLTLPMEFLILLTLKIQLLSLSSIMFAAIGIAHQDGKIDVMLVVNTIKTPYGVLCFSCLFITLKKCFGPLFICLITIVICNKSFLYEIDQKFTFVFPMEFNI